MGQEGGDNQWMYKQMNEQLQRMRKTKKIIMITKELSEEITGRLRADWSHTVSGTEEKQWEEYSRKRQQ